MSKRRRNHRRLRHAFHRRSRLRVWIRRSRRASLAFVLIGAMLAAWISFTPTDAARWVGVHSSPELLDRNGRTLHVFLNKDEQWCLARSLDEISPWLIRATIAAEDQRFWRHRGVDGVAVLRAAAQNIAAGRVVSGASTLSMQVAKLGGVRSHTMGGKLQQVGAALRLETATTKEAILRAYLNRAPYGQNLVGCEAASRRYLGKPASELSLAEAALLAALPRAPTSLMPLAHPDRARQRRNAILRRMRDEGMISAADCARAQAEPLGVRRHELPALAPHVAMRLRPMIAAAGRLRSTLDAGIQTRAESAHAAHLAGMQGGRIDGGAVIVLDPLTGEVLAHVGSPDFLDAVHAGQFDAVRALRAPGSTLKPFVYALALEQSRLYPDERLLDGVLDYGHYAPSNFDRRHRGLVTATQALRRSLNVPAVLVLERVGVQDFAAHLGALGIRLPRPAEYYGLGLTLGNCEVRLDHLASAYGTLAALGEYRPAAYLPGQAAPGRRVLSRGTCLSLYAMLGQPLPDRFNPQAAGVLDRPVPMAWKTGTSTGYRDAWAFAFNQHYVVGVWIGNPRGKTSRQLVGAEAALPLAADLLAGLPARAGAAWPAMDAGDLVDVEVCAASGLPATRWCASREISRLSRCQFLHRSCDVHWPRAASPEVVERWPAGARGWDLAAVGATVSQSSGLGPQEEPDAQDLRILIPGEGARYVLTGEPEGDRLKLTASQSDPRLHWFLDERYLGASTAAQPLWLELVSGDHRLVCAHPGGSMDAVRFQVTMPAGFLPFRQ